MYGPPGIAYVYLVYGMHDCLNVVTEPLGQPAAILIRSIEPIAGADEMRRARLDRALSRRRLGPAGRARAIARIEGLDESRLAIGPGSLTAAFDIDRSATGQDLCRSSGALWLADALPAGREAIAAATPRVGVEYAGEPWSTKPWRLVDISSPIIARGGV